MTPVPAPANQVLDREYLPIRAKLLEIAASLDRIDRGAGSVAGDPRMQQIDDTLAILKDHQSNRAEQLQLIFSREYDSSWRSTLQLEASD